MPLQKVKAPRGERGAFGRPEGEGGGPSGCWGTAHESNDTGADRPIQVTDCNSAYRSVRASIEHCRMKFAYSIAPPKRLYKNTVMLQNFNARIVCPYCHIPLAVADLEEATLHGRPCLICPECATVLVSQAEEGAAMADPEPAFHG